MSLLVLLASFDSANGATQTWTGNAGTGLWSTAGNWSGGVPGTGDTASFDSTSSHDCQISSNVSVGAITIDSAYAGTITQMPGVTLTIGSNGISMAGGVFRGGDAMIDVNGPLTLSGGDFRSTSGNLYVYKDFTISGATFNHNGGTVTLDGWSKTIDVGSAVLNHLVYAAGGNSITTNGTTALNGNLTIQSVNYMNGGTISIKGDVTLLDTALIGYPGTVLLFDGAGDQSLTAGVTGALAPSVTVNKTGGTLQLHGEIGIFNHWTHTSGSVNCGSDTLKFVGYDKTITAGTMTYGNVLFNTGGNSITISGTMDVEGSFTLQNVNYLNGGTIAVSGDVLTLDASLNGWPAATVLFDGSGDQKLWADGGYAMVPSVKVDKPGGTLTILDQIGVHKDWTHVAGDVDASASVVKFTAYDKTINAPGMAFGDVEVSTGGNSVTVTGSLRVNGDFLITSVNYFQGGTIYVGGDLASNDAVIQSWNAVTIVLDGAGDQLISANGGAARFPRDITINKTRCSGGAAILASDLTLNQSGQDLVVVEGALDLQGHTLKVNGSGSQFVIEDGGILKLEESAAILTNASYPLLQCGSMVAVHDGQTFGFPSYSASDVTGLAGNTTWSRTAACGSSTTPVACSGGAAPKIVTWREVRRQ